MQGASRSSLLLLRELFDAVLWGGADSAGVDLRLYRSCLWGVQVRGGVAVLVRVFEIYFIVLILLLLLNF